MRRSATLPSRGTSTSIVVAVCLATLSAVAGGCAGGTAVRPTPHATSSLVQHVWAVSSFLVLSSSDGGSDWFRQRVPSRGSLTDIADIDGTSLLSVSVIGAILRSTDAGATWQQQYKAAGASLTGVASDGADDCCAVGAWSRSLPTITGGVVLGSTDGGLHWRVLWQNSARARGAAGVQDPADLACPTAACIWVAGSTGAGAEGGYVSVSQDGGRHWRTKTFQGANCTAISATDAQHAWLTRGAAILATSDGGHTWQVQGRGTGQLHALADITMLPDGHGAAVGDSGPILTTVDWGKTWTERVYSGPDLELRGVAFADDLHGWAVGERRTVLATADGGMNWTLQTHGAHFEYLYAVCASQP